MVITLPKECLFIVKELKENVVNMKRIHCEGDLFKFHFQGSQNSVNI